MAAIVKFAVYGALNRGNQDDAWRWAKDVQQPLQQAIDTPGSNGVVKIDNPTMGGDPINGVKKHFAAIVEVNGVRRNFACEEGQTIDFT